MADILMKALRSVTAIPRRLLWVFTPDSFDEEPLAPPPSSRFGKHGFLVWLLSVGDLKEQPETIPDRQPSRLGWLFLPERLEERPEVEPKSEPSSSPYGKGGFFHWLFFPETLREEPEMKISQSRFGSYGFLLWLLSVGNLAEQPESAPARGRFGKKGFWRWLMSPDEIENPQRHNDKHGEGADSLD